MPIEVAIIFMLALLTFRLLTTVIHELGHAIPALLLTNEKVSVYMGSLGNPAKSLQFQIGRLECFFKFNLFYWKGGLCVMHEDEIPIRTSFIVTICGPLLSLIVATTGILILSFNEFGDVTKLVIFALVFSCMLDFLNNIFPNRDAISLHDGKLVYNDGKQLLYLWSIRKFYAIQQKAITYYNNQEYPIAAELFEKCIAAFPEDARFYKFAISSYLRAKQDAKAVKLQEAYSETFYDSFDAFDFMNLGNVEFYKENYDKALEAFEKAHKFNPTNPVTLNNFALMLGLLGHHEKAILHLDRAIELLAESVDTAIDIPNLTADCYCNLGFSKLELGQLEEGLTDTQRAFELNPSDAYIYRNFGLYHFYKKEYEKADEFYQKAMNLDSKIPNIQELINTNLSKLKN